MPSTAPAPVQAPTRTTAPELDPDTYHRADPEKLCPEQKERVTRKIMPHLP